MIKNWFLSVFGPSSRFNIGDSVQKIHGDQELMVVVEIEKVMNNKDTLVRCKYYDAEEKTDKTVFLLEKELEPFDWYHPKKRIQM